MFIFGRFGDLNGRFGDLEMMLWKSLFRGFSKG
jgi:hypothetical protein